MGDKIKGDQLSLPMPPPDSWEAAAIRELAEILHWLASGSFESRRDFLDRLANSARALAINTTEGETDLDE